MSHIERLHTTPIMHRVVRHGDVLYLGGIAAADTSADVRGQTTQVCERLQELLESAGSDATKVLSAVIYLSDFSLKNEMNEAWQAFFKPEDLPSRATLGVADLGKDVLVEVVATAAV